MFSGISENNHFVLMQFEVAIRDLLTIIINGVYHLVDNELVLCGDEYIAKNTLKEIPNRHFLSTKPFCGLAIS